VRTAAFTKAHLERHREYNVEWRKNHPDHKRKQSWFAGRSFSRLRGATGNHTYEEWLKIKYSTFGYCPACGGFFGDKLTKDHIIPVSIGGSDFKENLQPLCCGCNSHKRNNIKNYVEGGVLLIRKKHVSGKANFAMERRMVR
jgi:5-methylcytosine-specific restriction endonuclease McrA